MPLDSSQEIVNDIQNLAPTAIVELFELNFGDTKVQNLYFHAGTNELRQNVVWQGQEYMALPIEATGFDISAKGELPRPKLSIANIEGLFSSLIRQYDDLIGLKIIRHRTFAKYLDAVNFPNGNPTADPNIYLPDELWFIDRKEQENKLMISWELASAFDLQGVQLPRRQIIQNYCQWKYRGGECGYDGPYYNIDDEPCMNENDDMCAKKLSSCKCRFFDLAGTDKVVLPFGGFPGATRNNG